jgi:hypothetical protein
MATTTPTPILCRPLTTFPKKDTPAFERKSAPFRASYGQTIALLRFEVGAIEGETPVLELDLPASQLRTTDGMPYARSRPHTPRVVLSFTLPGIGPIRYPCDTFTDWEDNVRAIALGLEALRKIDRYGITTGRREQYRGFTALPPGASAEEYLDPDAAARVLLTHDPQVAGLDSAAVDQVVGIVLASPAFAAGVAKRALAAIHPDREKGNTKAFQKAERARAVLREHHKGGME